MSEKFEETFPEANTNAAPDNIAVPEKVVDYERQQNLVTVRYNKLFRFKTYDGKRDLHPSIYVGEFFGTFFFLLSAFLIASVANAIVETGGEVARLLVISMGFGFSLFVSASSFGFLSGGHYNPGVSLGLYLIGQISLVRFVAESAIQLLSGMTAAGVASALYPGSLTFANALADNISISRGLFFEATALCLLNLAVFMTNEPYKIGFSLFLGHLFCVDTTGAGINPARSFGPCVAASSFPGYHWIYWIGPIIGAVVSAGIYDISEILALQTDRSYKKDYYSTSDE